jgi:hypothetical protein
MDDTFGTESACVGMGSTCGGCGPGSTIGCGCSGRSIIIIKIIIIFVDVHVSLRQIMDED